MIKRFHRIERSLGIGLLVGVASLLVLGCIPHTENHERAPLVGVVPDNPVYRTASADDVRVAKTTGTTILSLPHKKRPSGGFGAEGTTGEKTEAFASLDNGPLAANEIRSLFSGIEVGTGDGKPETHRFSDNGQVNGLVNTVPERGIASETLEEDSGSWSVSHKSRRCLDWIDWYAGDPACYRVTKLGGRILLNGRRRTFLYHIQN